MTFDAIFSIIGHERLHNVIINRSLNKKITMKICKNGLK
jgi:hypothetical protein